MTHVAGVVVEVPARAVDKVYDYLIPEPWVGLVVPGMRVHVSFGRQEVLGYVWTVQQRATAHVKLKPLTEVIDQQPILTPDLLRLTEFLTSRTVCTRLDAIQAILPTALRIVQKRVYEVVNLEWTTRDDVTDTLAQKLWQALHKGDLTFPQVTQRYGGEGALWLERWINEGSVKESWVHKEVTSAHIDAVLVPTATAEELHLAFAQLRTKAPKQARLIDQLATVGEFRLKDVDLAPSDPAVTGVCRKGLAEVVRREVGRMPHAMGGGRSAPMNLTTWQQRAKDILVESLANKDATSFVLHGVTGSGKTEVFLQSVQASLELGGGAIVLVPEIALTPQMMARFQERFGETVAVLHSGLSQGEKRDEWLRIALGQAKVVVGARSAILAPVQNLRLIVVDEEHEPSYKQEESPRYDARDVAVFRSQDAGAVLVFASATPSLEAIRRVETGVARMVVLPQRVHGRPLPPVEIVDMREELKAGHRGILSRAVEQGLEASVGRGEQAILFLNRRGFASFVLCRSCGEVPECPNCDITLTLHKGKSGDWLHCHYCGFRAPFDGICDSCKEPAVRPHGLGTQQIEQWLNQRYRSWRVLRMDVDTTRRKGAHQALFASFSRGEADILVGTQMIAKGLDFPNVSFVGVVSADTMLSVPDYRSAERTFQLLTQVAGRAGRAETEGRTVIQTYRPTHYAIMAAAHHDTTKFYEQERAIREAFYYPPYCELTVFTATHAQAALAEGAAKRFERELKRRIQQPDVTVLPAVPAMIQRVENQYRFQVVVKYSQWSLVAEAVTASFAVVDEKMRTFQGHCSLDVNAGRVS